MGRRPSSDPKPKCPKHPDSYVVFDGKYGKPGHKRQHYRCWINGKTGKNEPFRRFVEQLPRQTTIGGVCVMCERDLHEHQGPSGPRNYCFSARDVAQALIDVGKGMTYSAAASAARRRADRFPTDGNGDRYTRHGQLVADWVEVFAPVVFEPFRRWDWPDEGTVVLDHLGFKVHAWTPDGRPKSGPVGFNVFAAMAYDGGVGRLWRLEAFPTASTPEWESASSDQSAVSPSESSLMGTAGRSTPPRSFGRTRSTTAPSGISGRGRDRVDLPDAWPRPVPELLLGGAVGLDPPGQLHPLRDGQPKPRRLIADPYGTSPG